MLRVAPFHPGPVDMIDALDLSNRKTVVEHERAQPLIDRHLLQRAGDRAAHAAPDDDVGSAAPGNQAHHLFEVVVVQVDAQQAVAHDDRRFTRGRRRRGQRLLHVEDVPRSDKLQVVFVAKIFDGFQHRQVGQAHRNAPVNTVVDDQVEVVRVGDASEDVAQVGVFHVEQLELRFGPFRQIIHLDRIGGRSGQRDRRSTHHIGRRRRLGRRAVAPAQPRRQQSDAHRRHDYAVQPKAMKRTRERHTEKQSSGWVLR